MMVKAWSLGFRGLRPPWLSRACSDAVVKASPPWLRRACSHVVVRAKLSVRSVACPSPLRYAEGIGQTVMVHA